MFKPKINAETRPASKSVSVERMKMNVFQRMQSDVGKREKNLA